MCKGKFIITIPKAEDGFSGKTLFLLRVNSSIPYGKFGDASRKNPPHHI
jgi:hypothetical protein